MNVEEGNAMNKSRSTVFYVGCIAIFVACTASCVLAGAKLGLIGSLPGCGVGSSCDTVTNGPWGTIPVINWPVSFFGVAWFFALLCGWLQSGGSSKSLLWLARMGVLGSVGFVIVMVGLGSYCKWCLLSHACNIVFWMIAELVYRRNNMDCSIDEPSCYPMKLTFPAFVVASVSLLFGWSLVSTLGESVDESTLPLLEARHRLGPANAPIQIVMFTDYQCPDCKRIERQLATIVESRDDVSVSVKHFPLNYDCNDNIGTFKLHSNACWAARAAEAASIVLGEEGWEKMHSWLFANGGSFTDQTLPSDLASLGFGGQDLINVMMSDETLQRVKSDADDGFGLGIYFTPMVFINGVEYLWYYGGEGSLADAIDEVALGVRAGDSVQIAPPSAAEKLVEDWRRGEKRTPVGHEDLSWSGGGTTGFVVWGDYQTDLTRELDREIKKMIQQNQNVRYAFRHFPIDDVCNASVSNMPTQYVGSCFIAKLVEAVWALSGDDARWNMHNWLLQQETPVHQPNALTMAAVFASVDEEIIQDVVNGITTNSRMRNDILSKNNVWRRSVPVLTIDGRFVPRWRSEEVTANELFHRVVDVVESESEDMSR